MFLVQACGEDGSARLASPSDGGHGAARNHEVEQGSISRTIAHDSEMGVGSRSCPSCAISYSSGGPAICYVIGITNPCGIVWGPQGSEVYSKARKESEAQGAIIILFPPELPFSLSL